MQEVLDQNLDALVFREDQSQMGLLNCVGCEKQNVLSPSWTAFLRFLRVLMYFGNKVSQKETWKYRLNVNID